MMFTRNLFGCACCLLLAFSGFIGCSEDNEEEPNLVVDATDGGGDDSTNDNDGDEATELAQAVFDACDRNIECAEEAGLEIDRETGCNSIEAFETVAMTLGQSCTDNTIELLNCIAETPCSATEFCRDETESNTDVCTP